MGNSGGLGIFQREITVFLLVVFSFSQASAFASVKGRPQKPSHSAESYFDSSSEDSEDGDDDAPRRKRSKSRKPKGEPPLAPEAELKSQNPPDKKAELSPFESADAPAVDKGESDVRAIEGGGTELSSEACSEPTDPDDQPMFNVCYVANPHQFIAIPSRIVAFKSPKGGVPSVGELSTYVRKKANLVCKHEGYDAYFTYGITQAATPRALKVKRSGFKTKAVEAEKYSEWHYELDQDRWDIQMKKLKDRTATVAKVSTAVGAALVTVSAAVPIIAPGTGPLGALFGLVGGAAATIVKNFSSIQPILKGAMNRTINRLNETGKIQGIRALMVRKLGHTGKAGGKEKTAPAQLGSRENYWGRPYPTRPTYEYDDEEFNNEDDNGGYWSRARPRIQPQVRADEKKVPEKTLIDHYVFSELICKKYKKNSFLRFLSNLNRFKKVPGENMAINEESINQASRKPSFKHRMLHSQPAGHSRQHGVKSQRGH